MTSEAVVDAVELRVVLPASRLATVEPVLWLLSPSGILTEDPSTLAGQELADDEVRVALYVAPTEVEGAVATLRSEFAQLGLDASIALRDVLRQDWNRVWKQHYHAFDVGPRLRVEPAWEATDEKPGQIRLIIDPGMAFGTGTHETTRLSLLAVQAWAEQELSLGRDLGATAMLDVGTGSAILAILAARLGVGRCSGTEIEAAAVQSAKENVALNGVQDRVTVLHTGEPSVLGPQQFELVVANILASILVPLRDAIVDRMAPGGTLILSGLLARESATVTDHYRARGLHLVSEATENGWAALTLRATA